MLRALLELSRVSNLPTVWTNVLAAWIIASGHGWRWTPALGWLLLGASLIYSAGMILNDAFDAAWDRDHRPERPIPSGRIGLTTVWAIGLAWLIGGAVIMIALGGASWLMTLLLLAAIVAYDAYHKPWAGSVIVMGACRTMLYLAVGSALGGSEVVVCSGVILGIYIVALTLAARSESPGRLKGVAAISGVLCLYGTIVAGYAEAATHLPSPPPQIAGWPCVVVSVVLLIWTTLALLHISKGGRIIGKGVGMLLAGIPLMDGLLVSHIDPTVTVAFLALPPLLRVWQRWVAAT